jgi:cyanate permease
MVAAILGGAAGPWLTGALYDATGSYSAAFWIAAGCSMLSALAIWLAAPRKIRAVAGRADRLFASRSRIP